MRDYIIGGLAGFIGYNTLCCLTKWGLWDVLEIIFC